MKRALIMSDLHCGHRGGLTPPDWQQGTSGWGAIQAECWKWYSDAIKENGPFDVVIVNGDAIEGKGIRSGGTELIRSDRHEQVEMAAECIRLAQGKGTQTIIIRGTPYHVGANEDFEDVLARNVKAHRVSDHEYVNIEGTVLDCRHHVGSSSVPHGRHTAIAKERLWNMLWAERGERPKGDVVIRSHVHYHTYAGAAGWLALTTPALQVHGSKFGGRMCSGTVDYGFVVMEFDEDGFTWDPVMYTVKRAVPKEYKV